MEEPPQKLTKYEMESQFLEGEVTEEAQEEWLSEGVLTDDDYNPASQQTEADQSDQNTTTSQEQDQDQQIQDQTLASESAEDSQQMESSQMEMETHLDDSRQYEVNESELAMQDTNISNTVDNSVNIEATLENFEGSVENNQPLQSQEVDLPGELSTFLTRKTVRAEAASSDLDETKKDEEDDGNDTDDLLRVLGDGGDQKDKEGSKNQEPASSDDDNEFVFQGRPTKNYELIKNALMRRKPAKAEPEDDTTDCSSDEATKSVASANKQKTTNQNENLQKPTLVQISSTVKPGNLTITPPSVPPRRVVKKVIQVPMRVPELRKPGSAPKQYVKRALQSTSLLKKNPTEMVEIKKEKPVRVNEIKQEESSEAKKSIQKMMKPEEMDEEVPTDFESDDDEESLYDELPTSGSDEEDWFTLDIRAERAGDYIPLLGDKAYELLLGEKKRVSAKLSSLKQSLHALSQASKEQAEKLRDATNTAAELDAMLKAV